MKIRISVYYENDAGAFVTKEVPKHLEEFYREKIGTHNKRSKLFREMFPDKPSHVKSVVVEMLSNSGTGVKCLSK